MSKKTIMYKVLQKLGSSVSWIAKQSWFFALFLFIGFLLAGSIKNKEDLFEKLAICIVFWLLDFLFLKKFLLNFLKGISNKYKKAQ